MRAHDPRCTSYTANGPWNHESADFRRSIHSPSCHWYDGADTIEAFSGGSSKAKPNGSDLRITSPCRVSNSNLYRSPRAGPGMKISQMPLEPSDRIGWRRPSHALKSPTTLTRAAFGAHTAK